MYIFEKITFNFIQKIERELQYEALLINLEFFEILIQKK